MGVDHFAYGFCDFCKKEIKEERVKYKENHCFDGVVNVRIPVKIAYPTNKYSFNSQFKKYGFNNKYLNICPECAQKLSNIIYDNFGIYIEQFLRDS